MKRRYLHPIVRMVGVALLAVVLRADGAGAQVLTLSAALDEARTNAFAVRMATEEADARIAETRLAGRGILPSARIEAGVVRTTDPIGAFATQLKQRAVTAAAFDPMRLNDPAAISNVQGGVVLDIPVFNLDAWMGRRAAVANADAGRAQSTWTIAETQRTVVEAYYGVILAAEQIAAMNTARSASEAWVRQADAMFRQGMVTKADGLQASVRVGEVTTQLMEARQAARVATLQLALILGRTNTVPQRASTRLNPVNDTVALTMELPLALPSDSTLVAFVDRENASTAVAADDEFLTRRVHDAIIARGDLSVAKFNVSAARFDVARNASALLPKINGFARVDWNAPRTVFGGRNNWTIGVLASWTVFSGGSTAATVRAASARLRAAEQAERATQARAAVEVATTRHAMDVARQRLASAGLQEEQSAEAQRLVALRYSGGLATIAELLAADATATQSMLSHSHARYALIVALAAYRHAGAEDLMTLTALESPLLSAR